MSKPTIIAAANSSYFLMTCLLMESIEKYASPFEFFALDFGLTEPERRFLRSKNALIEMPAGVAGISADAHPYFLKTAIVKYLDGIESASPIVWIDGDVVVGDDLVEPLNRVLAGMSATQSDVAACEECKVGDILAFAGLDFGPFRTMLEGSSISLDAPYFNGGFVIFRARRILQDWFEAASRTPFHALFDQNLLNVLIHSRCKVTALPEEEWNLHGRLLDEKSLKKILKAGKPLPKILHATSSVSGHIELVSCPMREDFGKSYPVRLFKNPALRQHQLALLVEFIGREFPHLKGTETIWSLNQAAPAADGKPQLKISRNSLCPCNSGKKFKHCHGRES